MSADTGRTRRSSPDTQQAWRWIGWYALVLAIAGIGDWILTLIPLRFGTPEWEFGTIAQLFSGLPLVTMGLAGLLGSAVARGSRWQVVTVSWIVLTFATLMFGALIVFLLDVPLALRLATGIARVGIMKAIAKTTLLGTLFIIAYVVGAIGALRRSRGAGQA